MKRLWGLLILLALFLLATGCGNTEGQKTTVEATISQLTQVEFESVGTHGLDNPIKDDFRKFTFNFEIEHAANVERKVEFPLRNSWKEAINSIDDKERYWYGGGHEQNNNSENLATYHQVLVFYSKGLNEDEMREAFNSINTEVYLDLDGETDIKEYKVSDLIEFDNNQNP
jgi:hypothetical protein